MGLRERKKLATRTAISAAAFRLLVEQGIDAVTPEAVAAEVGVSPRTFRNYYASREEAIIDVIALQMRAIVDALRARPADEPIWDSMLAVLPPMVAEIMSNRTELWALKCASMENPVMFAQQLAALEQVHRLMAETIAERMGRDVDRDLEPVLMAAAVGGAMRTAGDAWVTGVRDEPLIDLLREALSMLRAGIPIGNEARPGT
jgi:AcrR family transcriptional regulator